MQQQKCTTSENVQLNDSQMDKMFMQNALHMHNTAGIATLALQLQREMA